MVAGWLAVRLAYLTTGLNHSIYWFSYSFHERNHSLQPIFATITAERKSRSEHNIHPLVEQSRTFHGAYPKSHGSQLQQVLAANYDQLWELA